MGILWITQINCKRQSFFTYHSVGAENHYNAGDPLPILYHIENKVFYDVVTSMPFPLSDLDLNEHTVGYIVDSSIGRQLICDQSVS